MPPYEIYSDWTINLGEGFSRAVDEDGFVDFKHESRSVTCVVYGSSMLTAEASLKVFLHRLADEVEVDEQTGEITLGPRHRPDFKFAGKKKDRCGVAKLHRFKKAQSLQTLTAAPLRVACVDFSFTNPANLKWALKSWRSLRHRPPAWWAACVAQPDWTLAALCWSLPHDLEFPMHWYLANSGKLRQILLLALDDPNATVRLAACRALEELGGVYVEHLGGSRKGAVARIQQLAQDEAPEVRQAAKDVLRAWKVPKRRSKPKA